jgi:protocatechuate 3,4-dioxygenase beta subunit
MMKTPTRREFLVSGVAAAAALRFGRAHASTSACVLAAEQEQGPFYVDEARVRGDIREGKPGVPLALRLVLLDARTCQPLREAVVDLWHCDALGLYSGFTKTRLGPPPDGHGASGPPGAPPGPPPGFPHDHPPGPPPRMEPTDKLTFLRGLQRSDPSGVVQFKTIFPGYYQGRVNHVHFKVRVGGAQSGRRYAAGHTAHIGQLFFPEALAVKLMSQDPYRRHTIHRTTADEDGIFQTQHGAASVATVEARGEGLLAQLVVAIDPAATPAPVQPQLPPPRE